LEEEKMEKQKIMNVGVGNYAGTEVEVLPKDKVLEILDNVDTHEVYLMAYDKFEPGWISAQVGISLETGELTLHTLQRGEYLQAGDNNYIDIFEIGQNAEKELDPVHGENIYYFLKYYLEDEDELQEAGINPQYPEEYEDWYEDEKVEWWEANHTEYFNEQYELSEGNNRECVDIDEYEWEENKKRAIEEIEERYKNVPE
jgi:hypothetical protein